MQEPGQPVTISIDVIDKEGACAVAPNSAEAKSGDTVVYHNRTTKSTVISFADSTIFGKSEVRLDPDKQEDLTVNPVESKVDYIYSCDYATATKTEERTARPIIIVYPKEA